LPHTHGRFSHSTLQNAKGLEKTNVQISSGKSVHDVLHALNVQHALLSSILVIHRAKIPCALSSPTQTEHSAESLIIKHQHNPYFEEQLAISDWDRFIERWEVLLILFCDSLLYRGTMAAWCWYFLIKNLQQGSLWIGVRLRGDIAMHS
jgi:hypothetical protein